MAITIVATVGSASANSFVTEAEQIAYMATRLNASSWTTTSGATCTETEKAAMVEATRELSAFRWLGQRVDDTQSLAWPRGWVPNPDNPVGTWNYYSTTIIPQRVKDATAELAFQFLKAGTTDVAAVDPNAGVVEKTVDVITTRWAEWGARPRAFLDRYPSVSRFIRVLLLSPTGATTRVTRA